MSFFGEFIAIFKRISISTSQLGDAINAHKTATENATKARQLQEYPSPKISPELRLPIAVENAITKKCNEGQGWQKANVFVSGATALFTLFAFVAAAYYACVASRQLSQMIESNRINREAMTVVQRPYVLFPNEVQIAKGRDPKTKRITWLFFVAVKNSGNTPTRQMRMHVNFDANHTGEFPPDFAYPDMNTSAQKADPKDDIPILIGPNSKIYSQQLRVSADKISEVVRGDNRLFFYGWASYRDQFDKTPLHRTEFCFEIANLTIKGDSVGFVPASCRHHNCADDECKQ